MAYAKKTTAIVPENIFVVDAVRFWAGDGAISIQVRLDGEDKVFLSYWNENKRQEMLAIDVSWEAFRVEFKAMTERLKEQ